MKNRVKQPTDKDKITESYKIDIDSKNESQNLNQRSSQKIDEKSPLKNSQGQLKSV